MRSDTQDKQIAGKSAELHVFGEFLKLGAVSYLPLVDEGLDALVRSPQGDIIEVQITSCGSGGSEHSRWFLMPKFEPRKNFFILGVEFIEGAPADVWVLPSMVFDEYASGKTKGKSRNLDLDGGKRTHGMPLKDLLCGFKNRWELIVEYHKYAALMDSIDDLEDVITMKEAQEAPTTEVLTFEEHERRRATVPR